MTKQDSAQASTEKSPSKIPEDLARPGPARITTALLHRSFIKSYRDVVAYGIRIVMYLGTHSTPLRTHVV